MFFFFRSIIMTATAQSFYTCIVTWRLVIERNGTHSLYLLRIDSKFSRSAVKEKILALYHRKQPWWSRWLCRPVIGVVTVLRVGQHSMDVKEGAGPQTRVATVIT